MPCVMLQHKVFTRILRIYQDPLLQKCTQLLPKLFNTTDIGELVKYSIWKGVNVGVTIPSNIRRLLKGQRRKYYQATERYGHLWMRQWTFGFHNMRGNFLTDCRTGCFLKNDSDQCNKLVGNTRVRAGVHKTRVTKFCKVASYICVF